MTKRRRVTLSSTASSSTIADLGIASSISTGTGHSLPSGIRRANSSNTISSQTVAGPVQEIGSLDTHPLSIGSYVVVTYRDGSIRLARIVETNRGTNARTIEYYVHYCDFNRRMDEWIYSNRIVKYPKEANPMGLEREQLDAALKKSKAHVAAASSTTASTLLPIPMDTDTDNIIAPQPPLPISTISTNSNNTGDGFSTMFELDHDEHEGMDEASLIEHEEVTKVKNIRFVKLGRYLLECWYFSPFPKEYYPNSYTECLFFCQFTLRFFLTMDELRRYQKKPNLPRHPPGNEIYRDSSVSMFEVDGAVEKVYCQNLCYLAKLFLDHKTLYWDVDPFLFYVLCTRDEWGFQPVGYFSKEKYSDMGYNLACILTFPFAQRKGYGRFLIAFSYELSKKEEKAGSPEKPLSDLGAVGYRSYWAHTILTVLKGYTGDGVSIMDLTAITSMLPEDVLSTLNMLGLLRHDDSHHSNSNSSSSCSKSNTPSEEDKEGGGEGSSSSSGASKLNPVVNQSSVDPGGCNDLEHCSIDGTYELIDELLLKYPANNLAFMPDKLHWTPLYITDPKKDKWSIKSLREALTYSM